MSRKETAIEMANMEACLSNPQAMLTVAFQSKEIFNFRKALSIGANPELVDPNTQMSLFEKICQTPGSAIFIEECIRFGCNVDNVNTYLHKKPINFAAESRDERNLRALLQYQVDVDHTVDGLTPLHRLVEGLNETNSEEILQCVKALVAYQADVNICNARSVTPILTVAKKRAQGKEEIIKFLLENTKVELDRFRNGEARKLLTKDFPGLKLPEPKTETDNANIDFGYLSNLLVQNNEEDFIHCLRGYMNDAGNHDNKNNIFLESDVHGTLLQNAIKEGLTKAALELLQLGADVNSNKDGTTPVAYACLYGNWKILERILRQPHVNVLTQSDPLLCIVVKKLGEGSPRSYCNYYRCFNLLLNDPRIDINARDMTGSTALHYAVRYKNDEAIKELLAKAAYIGTYNRFYDLPITDINPKLLEKYFDSCITTNNLRPGDDNFEIRFDYSCLVPAKVRHQKEEIDEKNIQFSEEMVPIEHMSRSSDLKHLIKHPLISSFLFLKWHRLGLLFYTNLLVYSCFCLSLILYLVFCYGHDVSKEIATCLWVISALGILYVAIRECFQFLTDPCGHFKIFENYIELALIILACAVLYGAEFDESVRRVLAAVVILLAAVEFSMLVGSLPVLSISTHMVMLKTVSISFMRSLMLYSILLVAFGLCFYTLIGGTKVRGDGSKMGADGNNSASAADGNEENDDFNKFIDPGTAILKTIVMMTGEFEAANIEFNVNVYSYLIFLLFVFFMSIVLFNLLNGLAVSDTQAIKSEAELMGFLSRAQVLARYEKLVLGKKNGSWNKFLLQNCLIRHMATNLICCFPKFLPLKMLILLPNNYNKLVIPSVATYKKGSVEETLMKPKNGNEYHVKQLQPPVKPLMCCWVSDKCSRMDGKIVKYARRVLDNRQRAEEHEKEKQEDNDRLKRIEERIEAILNHLELKLRI